MQVVCQNCTTTYKIDVSKIPRNDATTTCSKCDSKIHIESTGCERAAEGSIDSDTENQNHISKINQKKTDSRNPKNNNGSGSKFVNFWKQLLNRQETDQIINDLKSIKFREEIIPIDKTNISILKKDFVFWAVAMLGITPLFLISISDRQFQLSAFAIFFAIIWGVIFKKFVVENTDRWQLPLRSALFTGIVGINILGFIYKIIPPFYNSKNEIVSLFGYLLFVGPLEELCKIVPVIIYIFWKRSSANAFTIIIIGIFSGLGFAAFENISYYNAMVEISKLSTNWSGDINGEITATAMIVMMLRSISLVFCHATWSGIFAYFLALGHVTKKRRVALFIVGLSVSALIHGMYDWFCGIEIILGAIVVGFSFILFYAYKTKLRLLIAE